VTRGDRLARTAVVLAALFGAGLRLVNLFSWPPGPWVDEAYALRAERLLAAGAPFFGTTALTPSGEGFVNSWATNVYLSFARAVDVAAGGGIASFRWLSAAPALALFAALLLLALEAGRERPLARGAAALLGASSMWLLTTGRWGWDAVATSALAALATWGGLRSARTGSAALALAAGACAGLGVYGYAAGRLFFAAPAVVLVLALARRSAGRELACLAGLALAAEIAVVAPLAAHYASHPDRLFAREQELSLLRHGGADAGLLLARNVADYGAVFLWRGDVNERHGDPARPVLPAAVAGLALLGAAAGAVRGGSGRALLLPAGLFLAGGLLASEETGANAYRISPMAPYVVVLAGLGADALVGLFASRARKLAAAGVAAVVALAAAADVVGFARWGASPRTWGAFGGPERALADALVAASRSGPPARIVLDWRSAARNPYVVEELLAPPGARRGPVIFAADFTADAGPLRQNVLYADGGALEAAGLAGRRGTVVARGTDPWGKPTFTVYRLSPD
jgi:4-amino-4-deoxy-L-arabinose transferase-like glycosyltransferase